MLMAVEPNKQSGPAGERRPYVATFVLYDAHKASMPFGHVSGSAHRGGSEETLATDTHNEVDLTSF